MPRPRAASRDAEPSTGGSRQAFRAGEIGLLLLAFLAAALLVYRPAFGGPFMSDDVGYVVTNRYIHELSAENLQEILDPWGMTAAYTANYAPVHMLGHALEWRVFGANPRGYHIVNAVLHAGVSALLAVLFAAWGIARPAAVLGAAVFLLHPANVEAVAWIFQLKTVVALGLALGALVAHPRRPALGALLFALALLTKIAALFALPAALAMAWVRRTSGVPARFAWLGVWAVALLACAVPQFEAFERMGDVGRPPDGDAFALVRTIGAIGARYLVMAATSYGVSAFHQPAAALSPLDPWWLVGVAAAVLFTWRALATLRRGSEEAAFWIWAAAAWAPISQVFPFLYPMADRYLYFILPGLIGGALVALRPVLGAVAAAAPSRTALAVLGALMLLAVGFGFHSAKRAAIWRYEGTLLQDAAQNYPDGYEAHMLRAMQAARSGDARGTVGALRPLADRGFDRFSMLETLPAFAAVRGHPEFRALVADVAGQWIEHVQGRESLSQAELSMLGRAHLVRGEPELAVRRLEQALALGGPWHDDVTSGLAQARAALRRERPAPAP